jgi:hypothetical protein
VTESVLELSLVMKSGTELKSSVQTSSKRMIYHYKIHGLNVASELRLPELAQHFDVSPEPELWIKLLSLPEFDDAKDTELGFAKLVNMGVLFTIENAGRFLVRDGREIIIDIQPNSDPGLIRIFLFGSVMGMICAQRGMLALHASSVVFHDRVIAFTGDSGAGKSTLAAHCLNTGAKLMSDDLLVVSAGPGSKAVAHPGMPGVKLWLDALVDLGRETKGLRADWFRSDKFHVPVEYANVPLPLARLYVLKKDDTSGAAEFKRLTGALAIDAIIGNSYRMEFIELIGGREWHFQYCAMLAQTIEVFELRRNNSLGTLSLTASRIKSELGLGA